MAASDARPVPIKNTAFRAVFPILDADGDLVTGATGLDSEVSKDQGTFADCTNEATEIATSSGIYYLDLTSTEMNADCVAVIVKTTSTGAKTTVLVFYPEETGDINVDVTAWLGTAVSTPTVAGVPNVNVKTWNDLTTVALPLVPTTAGRTLDVSAGGEAGVDWANVGSQGTTVALSGTTISTSQAVASVAGAVGSVTGSVGSISTGGIAAASFAAGAIDAAAIASDAITDAKVASDVTIASVTGAVGSVTGNVGGNVTGSVGSVATGGIAAASFAAGAINAAAIADAAIDRATFAADTGLQTIRSNTAQAGSGTTITLDASASAVDNAYKGKRIIVTSGTGSIQDSLCTGYVGSTKVATVTGWTSGTNPTSGSTFAITNDGGVLVDRISDQNSGDYAWMIVDGSGYVFIGNQNDIAAANWQRDPANEGITTAATSYAALLDGVENELAKVPKSDSNVTWNATAAAQLQSEANDALVANGLDHLLAASVTGTDITDNSIIAKLVSKSATADWDSYVNTTDALEALRDRGDAAWITATGFSTHSAADVWTSGTRTLTAGTNIQLPSNGLANVTAWTVNVTGSLSGNVGGVSGVTFPSTVASPTNITSATGVVLAASGLDSITTTAPSGVASNFREMIVQLWRRFFKKATKSSTQILTYADNGTTVVTTQTISSSGSDQTQGAAS